VVVNPSPSDQTSKFKNSLFALSMFTYTFERVNTIQIAFKGLPRGVSAVIKTLSDLALPLHVVYELLKKCSYVGTPINYGKKV
jgi:hypothetical protein